MNGKKQEVKKKRLKASLWAFPLTKENTRLFGGYTPQVTSWNVHFCFVASLTSFHMEKSIKIK